VLFVAEKRRPSMRCCRGSGRRLSDIALDIHEGTRDRLRIARDLGDALDAAQLAVKPEVGDLHRRLRTGRNGSASMWPRCTGSTTRGGEPVPGPVRAAGIDDEARTMIGWHAERIDRQLADQIRDELREFAHLGGFAIRPQSTRGSGRTGQPEQAARPATWRCGSAPGCCRCWPTASARPATRPAGPAAQLRRLRRPAAAARRGARDAAHSRAAVYAADPARLAAATGDGPASACASAARCVSRPPRS